MKNAAPVPILYTSGATAVSVSVFHREEVSTPHHIVTGRLCTCCWDGKP